MEFHELWETWKLCDALDHIVAKIKTPGVVYLFLGEIGNLGKNKNGGHEKEMINE